MKTDAIPVLETPVFLMGSTDTEIYILYTLIVVTFFTGIFLLFYKRIKTTFSLYQIKRNFHKNKITARQAAYDLSAASKGISLAAYFINKTEDANLINAVKYRKEFKVDRKELSGCFTRIMLFTLAGKY